MLLFRSLLDSGHCDICNMNDEQQQELYRAIVINPFKDSEDQDLEALKQSAIDLYNDIMSALNEAENESESELVTRDFISRCR